MTKLNLLIWSKLLLTYLISFSPFLIWLKRFLCGGVVILLCPIWKQLLFMYLMSFDVFVHKNDSCIMINSLVTSFTSESGLGSESGLSCVIHPGCYWGLYQIVLFGLILLPTVWLVPRWHPVSPLDPKEFLITNLPLGMTVLAVAALGLIPRQKYRGFL